MIFKRSYWDPVDSSDSTGSWNATEKYKTLFWVWLVGRTLVWLTVAISTQPNPPLDFVEWTSWSNVFCLGYPKHPPLPAWIAGSFVWLSGGYLWSVYVAGYLFSGFTVWSVWRLGREFLSSGQSLLAAICLDGLIYATGDPSEFSNNVVLNSAWSLTALLYILGVKSSLPRYWIGLGISAGLGLLSKYTLGVLLLVLVCHLLAHSETRKKVFTPGPWIALLLALAIFLPHGVWLWKNDFITLKYAAERSSTEAGWLDHLKNPAAFLLDQSFLLLPVLAVLWPALGLQGRRYSKNDWKKKDVLAWITVGPLAFLLALSLITGCKLRDIWGSPLWSFIGIYLLAFWGKFDPGTLVVSFRVWGVVAAGMLAFCLGRNLFLPYLTHRPTRIHFPGKNLANEVLKRWKVTCEKPFPIVAGEAWHAGNICVHSFHKPKLYSSGSMGYLVFDNKYSPWTSDEEMTQIGGVLVWDASKFGAGLPDDVRKRFPMAKVQEPVVLGYQTGAGVPQEKTGLAFVFPPGTE